MIRYLLAASLVACAPALKDAPPAPPVPTNFAGAADGPSVAAMDWRTFFTDAALSAVIGEALAHNLDLQIAAQRIESARARVGGAAGALLPSVNAVAGASVNRFARYTLDGSGVATTDITPGRPTPNPVGEMSFGLQASWEPDLWGKLRNLRGSARAQYLASLEGARLVTTNLVGDVASAYYELVALDETHEILRETVARQEQGLEMIRAQKDAGRTNELAVQQFTAQVATTRALEATTTLQLRELEARINVLLGRMPQAIARTKDSLAGAVPTTLATGVPSELLRNRPDIREAELAVSAAKFDLAAARAAFYPSVEITAGIGFGAFEPRYLLRPASILASLTGGLVGPLINRAAIKADFAVAQASQLEAVLQYQRVVLTSFAEVAATMAGLEQAATIVEQRKLKQTAMASTIETADALFRAGKANYLEVLVAQQSSLEADLELVEAQRDQHIARVKLYRALGGGWR